MLADGSSTRVYHAIVVGGKDVAEGVRLALPPPWRVHCCECLDQAKQSFLNFQSCVILSEAYPPALIRGVTCSDGETGVTPLPR